MRYRIEIPREAKHDLRRLPGFVRQRFERLTDSLAGDPRPPEAQELRDHPSYYRTWVDRWRLIHRVDDRVLVVVVIRAQEDRPGDLRRPSVTVPR